MRGYIRVTSDAFRKSSREMHRVAQPRKKHALLGNVHGDTVRTCVCTKRWEKGARARARVRMCIRGFFACAYRGSRKRMHINAEAGKRAYTRESRVT